MAFLSFRNSNIFPTHQFKIGDKVLTKLGDYGGMPAGCIGVITVIRHDALPYGVDFGGQNLQYNKQLGWSGSHSCGQVIADNHGYWCKPEWLTYLGKQLSDDLDNWE